MFDKCFQTENSKHGNSICKNKTKLAYLSKLKVMGFFWGGEEVGVEEKGGNLYLECSWWLLLVDAGKYADFKNCGSSSTAKWRCCHFCLLGTTSSKGFPLPAARKGSWKTVLYFSLSPEDQSISLALRLSYLWNLGLSSCFLWTTINYLESKMHVLLMAMLVSEDCSLMVQRQAWIHHGLVNRALIRGGLASLCSSWHSLQHSVLMCWWALLLA